MVSACSISAMTASNRRSISSRRLAAVSGRNTENINRGAGRSRNFASSAGAATLLLELYDSVSGEIMARAVDRQADNETIMRWTNRVTNTGAARRIFTRWARLLGDRLDELRGNGAE